MSKVEELKAIAEQITALVRQAPPAAGQREAFAMAEARAYSLLAAAQWYEDELSGAEDSLDHALTLRRSGGLLIRRAALLPRVLPSREKILAARDHVRARLSALLEAPAVPADAVNEVAWTLFLLAYHAEQDNLALHRLFHRVCSRADLRLDWVAPHCRSPRRAGRPRVGFISWYFREHTISRLFSGLLQAFDSEACEVSVFSFRDQDEALAKVAMPGKNRVSLPADLVSAQRQIAAADLDLLIYLDLGMDYLTLFLAHARLARRQGVLWGHPDTTGLDSMDFFFSPGCMEPPDGESHYGERLIRLPGPTVVYSRPQPQDGVSRSRLRLPPDGVLYLCPQTPFKFHPDFDRALAEILRAVPGSYLILTAGGETAAMERVKTRIAKSCPESAARIQILGSLSRTEFVSLFEVCDVVLDPFHYSGGNTSLEAFASGTPTVTWPGTFMRARHTAGFYRLMDLPDLVARDHDHYIELAIRLGIDVAARTALREKIRDAAGALYDQEDGVRAIEQFVREEHAGWTLTVPATPATETRRH
jgi:predicted O-linked N-acetylglucosamine transferase (SPINDLY family)